MNCGECLMEHQEIVPLRPDGSCPCCERGHRNPGESGDVPGKEKRPCN